MTLLVVGLSHHSAPVSVLERTTIAAEDMAKVLEELHRSEAISEVMAVSTCNRIEVYADVDRFHPAVADISAVLARGADVGINELGEHLYVHFAEGATGHLFQVASGLDSMVVGESQILGQLRAAYAFGTSTGTVGRVLHDAVQNSMRIGKRVHSETGIDRAAPSVVSVALAQAAVFLAHTSQGETSQGETSPRETSPGELSPGELPSGATLQSGEASPVQSWSGKRVVLLGAGSMGALAGATLSRLSRPGAVEFVVVNRGLARGQRLAETLGGRAAGLEHLAAEIAEADVLISTTGSTGLMLGPAAIAPRDGRQLVVLDLAMPRDVDPAVADLPDVRYIDLEMLRSSGAMVSDAEVRAATSMVGAELRSFLNAQHALAVAPTVTALRARAAQVVDAELLRLDGRVPGLDQRIRAEVADAVRRAVDKVLHAPTVRVKELAATPEGDSYAEALRTLFDLAPAAAESVAAVRNADLVGAELDVAAALIDTAGIPADGAVTAPGADLSVPRASRPALEYQVRPGER